MWITAGRLNTAVDFYANSEFLKILINYLHFLIYAEGDKSWIGDGFTGFQWRAQNSWALVLKHLNGNKVKASDTHA